MTNNNCWEAMRLPLSQRGFHTIMGIGRTAAIICNWFIRRGVGVGLLPQRSDDIFEDDRLNFRACLLWVWVMFMYLAMGWYSSPSYSCLFWCVCTYFSQFTSMIRITVASSCGTDTLGREILRFFKKFDHRTPYQCEFGGPSMITVLSNMCSFQTKTTPGCSSLPSYGSCSICCSVSLLSSDPSPPPLGKSYSIS